MFESFSVVAEAACDDRELFDAIPTVLPPGWRPGTGDVAARFELTQAGAITRDGTEVAHTKGDRSAGLLRLGSTVRHHLALLAPDHVFIHAGVVSVGGASIVIPGSSHSGKTTLVAELVRAGATYYSDEYAPVDPEGLIAPYPKPLSVRGADGEGLGALQAVPEPQIATQPTRADLVVVTRYEAGATWRPEPCTGGEGALALLKHTVAARPRPSKALAAVGQLAREARVIAGIRGEAAGMADALIDLAADRTPAN